MSACDSCRWATGNISTSDRLIWIRQFEQLVFDPADTGSRRLAGTTVLIYAAFNLVAGLISYPAGFLSDRWGRKNILLAEVSGSSNDVRRGRDWPVPHSSRFGSVGKNDDKCLTHPLAQCMTHYRPSITIRTALRRRKTRRHFQRRALAASKPTRTLPLCGTRLLQNQVCSEIGHCVSEAGRRHASGGFSN